jgi:hypothetical protein
MTARHRSTATAGGPADQPEDDEEGSMIIWGWRALTKTVSRGNFFCPDCGQQQAYSRRLVRRFFTLYFIPLFPTKTLGEYIECDVCKNAYKDKVLEYNPLGKPERMADVA